MCERISNNSKEKYNSNELLLKQSKRANHARKDFRQDVSSVSNTIFGNAVSTIGWGNLILIWFILMAVGTVNMIPFRVKKD